MLHKVKVSSIKVSFLNLQIQLDGKMLSIHYCPLQVNIIYSGLFLVFVLKDLLETLKTDVHPCESELVQYLSVIDATCEHLSVTAILLSGFGSQRKVLRTAFDSAGFSRPRQFLSTWVAMFVEAAERSKP